LPENYIKLFLEKMEKENLPKIVLENFEYYYNLLLKGETGLLPESSINAVNKLTHFNELDKQYNFLGEKVLHKAILLKLNGGLGTSMGLSEAKSLLKVKNGYTFLDIIANQAIYSKVPLVLMDSFNTHEKSIQLLQKYDELKSEIPFDFLQHKIPKIGTETYKPVEFAHNSHLEWCPPGHGEIYTALITSGMLNTFLENGFEYAFISNADNLGAVIDLKILGYFQKNNFPFLMEVADRTEADKKGGHLAEFPNGQLVLREAAQCPKEDEEEFQNINKHKFFNTNNIWINLKSLKSIMEENKNILGLPMIVNKKNVDPKNHNSEGVFQLETAMGSAISIFKGASALVVPRTRFAPVKTTNDLLAVRSDNYILTEEFSIITNPKRKLNPLVVKLDHHYKHVDDLDKRFPHDISLADCEKFTVKGNYLFGKNVKVKGNVVLDNKTEHQIKIEDNSILEGQ
jgi:UTP--glucose-1-phosphate uridylyltransferase